MAEILTDLSAPKIVSAIEENLVLCVHQLNDNPQAEFHDDPDLLWSISDIPVPVFTPVLRASLAPANVDVAIMTVIARSRAQRARALADWSCNSTSRSRILSPSTWLHPQE